MDLMKIETKPRQRQAKGDNRRLRREGRVPAIIYGGGPEPVAISVDNHELELVLRGARRSTEIFEIAVGREAAETTLIRDMQRHPVTSNLMHVDFLRIDLTKEIEVEVSVHQSGETPLGVREGGLLDHITRTVQVRCKPTDIPSRLEMDISELDVNDSVNVGQLILPANVTLLNDPDTPLFAIHPPTVEEEPEVGEELEGEETAEPEVIGEKKEEEEEGEESDKAGKDKK